ncbi:hypothetical protein C8046_13290 [Serinibacter arcticus]|uniref:Lipoprotein n=1 Tax=Serinibacter arcticus TaxID=1655435 RepID=A0A2U1ZWZ3_9MICO|nr:hypothetical protein [Serinibacter arcticus]PWD51484.1 hypothetical protein C8046_13290 [Serinibacter arcticus]
MATSRQRRRPVTPALLAAACAVAITLAACGSGEDGAAPEPAETSPSASTEADAVTQESTPSPEDTEDAENTAEQASPAPAIGDDTEAFLAHFTQGLDAVQTAQYEMELWDAGYPSIIAGVIDYTRSPIAASFTMPAPDDPDVMMHAISLDGVMYMYMGERSQHLWVEATGMTEAYDPIGDMRDFSQAITSVVREGSVQENGVPAERYTVMVDPTRLPAGELDAGTVVPEELKYKIYLDAEGRPIRSEVSIGTSSVTIRMSGFNGAVSIEAPPADEILSFEEYQGSLG